ncbi:inositol polyphosphate phosphatase [Wolfiporia cocos MD-104 SS10]|uniref:phosphoinositide 5-phosphatase n=1 Tax=Wolfiporia cocos (strain MD-104) TaxID=742152 RepID=A0A2H3JUF2_WOLCO|nr:inositol polyphosphate phosphatase [Wolfiporia cocos MD-104 SS10]
MHLYVTEHPRRLYLVTSSYEIQNGRPSRALVFQAAEDSSSQVLVHFLPKDHVDLESAVKVTTKNVSGTLGLVSIANDIFLAIITSSTEVGNTRPSAPSLEVAAQIQQVSFYSLTSSVWDDSSSNADSLPSPSFSEQVDNMVRDPYAQSNGSPTVFEHPCAPLTKLISGGTFYYALGKQWDISTSLSARLKRKQGTGEAEGTGVFDDRFVWNEYIVRSLLDFREGLDPHERDDLDKCHFIVLAIQGYVGVSTFALPAPPTNGKPIVATLSLISRLGWRRSGTRFNTRGVDDDGNCANFVETETVMSTEQHCFSYVQVRGSVPLFWEQQGLQTFGHKIQITRPQASQPAFDRHMLQLTEQYGSVHIVNLLGSKENETLLSAAYMRHLQAAKSAVSGEELGMTNYDFHGAVRVGGHESVFRDIRRLEGVADNIEKFFFSMTNAPSDEIVLQQYGVFRTNCLDCLDRTNFVQDILSHIVLDKFFESVSRREWSMLSTVWTHHAELWAENGDALSRIYAGTGALNTSFTRSGKRTLAGVLSDATKSVSRAYINNFQDKGKQQAIDMFVGNFSGQKPITIFDPVHDTVRRVLEARLSEYSSTKPCSIFVGTWNLNGKVPSAESLLPWLNPRPNTNDPDIFVIGFQEIVPLTAQQIVQADTERRREWEKKVLDSLNQREKRQCDYILLRSQQLVGTALLVLVKSTLVSDIRNVEAAAQKTGLRGMSGNKGAVGIRLDYHDTSFCFVTAHLAAGHTNVEERNADYRTISNGLHFLKGKTIDSHDNVIWLADTNYRIDLENDRARFLAEFEDYDALVAADQLKRSIDEGSTFVGYQEGPLLFRPTYKYDVGTDDYDTGEKMRIPAWTDRILYKGALLDLAVYSRAELKSSDHRPVFAIFRTDVRAIDHVKRSALSRLLTESVTTTTPGEKLDEKLANLTFTSDAPDLPAPSSDDAAWWDVPEYPNGIFVPSSPQQVMPRNSNPFDSPTDSPLSSSPSSSEEELYHALQSPMAPVQAARRPPPPPPPPPSRSNKPAGSNRSGQEL